MGMTPGLHWNYTTYLNILFLALAAVLIARFLHTDGPEMLRVTDGDSGREHQGHAHRHAA